MAVNGMEHSRSGFTLLEMMVVLAIIGCLVGASVMSITANAGRRVKAEAERIHKTLQLASDEAVFQGEEIGTYFNQTGYGFLHYNVFARRWETYNDGVFKFHNVPDNVTFALSVDRQPVVLSSSTVKEKPGIPPPMILFLSSGESSSFEIALATLSNKAKVIVESHGASEVLSREVGE